MGDRNRFAECLARDLTLKLNLYKKHGVRECRDLRGEEHGGPQICGAEDKVRVEIFEDPEINLKSVFVE
ncbi:MAG TPA: hypothetical protein VLH40_03785 [Atribacteraceae bacterium]|nr:hypothetical protein [Atribacteraceae bacterium]